MFQRSDYQPLYGGLPWHLHDRPCQDAGRVLKFVELVSADARVARKSQVAFDDCAGFRPPCCRIGEATGMPLIDPTLTSLLQRSAFWPMREIPALKSAILDAHPEAFHVSIG